MNPPNIDNSMQEESKSISHNVHENLSRPQQNLSTSKILSNLNYKPTQRINNKNNTRNRPQKQYIFTMSSDEED